MFIEDPVLTRLFRDARACELYANRDEAFAVIERHASVLGRSWTICRADRALVSRRGTNAGPTPRREPRIELAAQRDGDWSLDI